ncbi:methyltransferase type 11 [Rhodococcus sp. HNM0569]|nr:methyltransferase type 11 [Rhodococcus sp. HNM0569]
MLDVLACPVCGAVLSRTHRTLTCPHGHAFDLARQGYVTLVSGAGSRFDGDDADMIAARERFLGTGWFAPLADALADEVVRTTPAGDAGTVVEVGAGTGYYLAHVLDRLDARGGGVPASRGVGLDASRYAARRIARVHERVGALVADGWSRLPLREGAATHMLSVFAPRNAAEADRVLTDEGVMVVLAPTPRHQRELIEPLGLVHVDAHKDERLDAAVAGRFVRDTQRSVEYAAALSRSDVAALVGMGPSTRHRTRDELAAAIDALPDPLDVTASVTLSTFRRA